MSLSKRQISGLISIMESVQSILLESKNAPAPVKGGKGTGKAPGVRTRRTGKELEDFKKAIKKDRKAGVSVGELAEKYGVTPSYLYQLKD